MLKFVKNEIFNGSQLFFPINFSETNTIAQKKVSTMQKKKKKKKKQQQRKTTTTTTEKRKKNKKKKRVYRVTKSEAARCAGHDTAIRLGLRFFFEGRCWKGTRWA